MRTIVNLTEEQISSLAKLCEYAHLSRAEAIRRAIDQYLDQQMQASCDNAFGIWKGKKIDSLDYQDKLRDEWRK